MDFFIKIQIKLGFLNVGENIYIYIFYENIKFSYEKYRCGFSFEKKKWNFYNGFFCKGWIIYKLGRIFIPKKSNKMCFGSIW